MQDPDLVDPDAGTDAKYTWDEEFQRHVAAMLISDRQFLLQSIDLVHPNYFTNKAHSKICSIVFEFFKKYKTLPRKDFIAQEIKTQLKDSKSLAYYLGEINVLFEYFQPGLEAREYLQDKIVFFAKIQAVKKAFHDSLRLIDKSPESEETWSKIYDGMRDAMQTHQNLDIGLDYFNSVKDRYNDEEQTEEEQDRFVFGLPNIDNKIGGGGYSKGEIISVVAGSGVGKSVMLACIAANNLKRQKRGVYISLELAEEKVATRLDAIFTGLPVQNLFCHKNEIFDELEREKIRFSSSEDIGPLIIKQFPAGTATVNTIRAYLSQLKFQGFDPDFLIVDYVGEMALHPELKSHESRERIVRELRGMAMEEKVFIATAMQPNRDGKKDNKSERGRIDDEHLADSFGQIRPLDGCISLNQNDSEKHLGIGRAYVIKQRDGESRFQIYLQFNKDSLRIVEIDRHDYLNILNNHKEYASEETNIDMVKDMAQKKMKERLDSIENSGEAEEGDGGYESYSQVCEEQEDN